MKYIHEELIKNGYELVFEDHFDKNTLNENIWNNICMCQEGKNGREAWRLPENVSVKNSNLIISAHIEKDGRYTSGMINTNKKFAYKYGYAEIRAKLPKGGPGIWPGFWTQSQYKGSKVNSEIDIFEMFGDDSYIASSMHAWWTDKVYKRQHHLNYNSASEENWKRIPGHKMSDDWHTIGFFWCEDYVDFTVDGEPYQHIDISSEAAAPFHTPIYFIISMAFGLPFLNPPREDRTEPVEYKIDYIRIYQNETGRLYGFDKDGYLTERKN